MASHTRHSAFVRGEKNLFVYSIVLFFKVQLAKVAVCCVQRACQCWRVCFTAEQHGRSLHSKNVCLYNGCVFSGTEAAPKRVPNGNASISELYLRAQTARVTTHLLHHLKCSEVLPHFRSTVAWAPLPSASFINLCEKLETWCWGFLYIVHV